MTTPVIENNQHLYFLINTTTNVVTLSANVTGNIYAGTSLTFAKIKSGDSIRINNFEVTFTVRASPHYNGRSI